MGAVTPLKASRRNLWSVGGEEGIGFQEGQLGGISHGNGEASKDGAEASFPIY